MTITASASSSVVIATGAATAKGAGIVTVKLKLNAAGRKAAQAPEGQARRRCGSPRATRSVTKTVTLRAQGISRTITRFVAPGVPVRRPAVSTTRAPGSSPAKSRAVTSARSIISSTDSAVGMLVG